MVWTNSRLRPGLLAIAAAATLVAVMLIGTASASAQPAITITSGPIENGYTNAQNIDFAMSATVPDTNDVDFFCSIDDALNFYACDATFFPACVAGAPGSNTCTLSKHYYGLAPGDHVFRVFAADCTRPCDPTVSGIDGPLVTRLFHVDRTPPTVALAAGPTLTSPALSSTATFSFTASEPTNATCAIDIAGPASCTSGIAITSLKNGRHSVTITVTDLAGNASVPLVHPFLVDAFKSKHCKKPRGKKANRERAVAVYRKCKKSNRVAKAKWKKKHGLS